MQKVSTAKPRISIITPGQIGSNPRVVKEADELHAAGYRVTLIASRLSGKLELPSFEDIPWRFKLIDLRSRSRWRRVRAEQLLFRRLAQAFGHRKLLEFGQNALVRPLMRLALQTPADLYIAHYPSALPAAAAAAERYGRQFAYDAEDFHLGDWPEAPAFEHERKLVRAIESRHLPLCAFISAASPLIADALAQEYGIKRPEVLLNVFPKVQAPAVPSACGTAVPSPSLYWFSQTIGPDRGLECAIAAIGLAKARPHLFLQGVLAKGYERKLEMHSRQAGVQGRVHCLPPAEPDAMERLSAAYDLGLASETLVSRNRQICLTNKLFSFLLAGLPPLLSDTPAQRQFAAEAGLTDLVYPIDDAQALAHLLDRYLLDPELLAATRARIWQLGQQRYSWESEGTRLRRLVSLALTVNSRSSELSSPTCHKVAS